MGKKAKKPTEVAKVSAETGVDVKDLNRLPQDALEKLDALVPDADEDLLGGDSVCGDEASEIPKSDDVSESDDSVSSDQEGSGVETSDGAGLPEVGSDVSGGGDVVVSGELAGEHGNQSDSSSADGVEEKPSDVTPELPKSDDTGDAIPGDENTQGGDSSGSSEPSQVGTLVVGEIPGAHHDESETPKSPDEVEDEERSADDADDVPVQPSAGPVVDDEELDVDGDHPLDIPEDQLMVIGEHPATGEPVRICDQ